jgi:hypothetical protein
MAQIPSTTDVKATAVLAGRQCRVLIGIALLLGGLGSLAARPALALESQLPQSEGGAAPADDGAKVRGDAEAAPLSELAKSLAAARDRLEELSKLTKQIAVQRSDLEALQARDRQMAVEIEALRTDRRQLSAARDAAASRAQDLGKALDQVTATSQALGEQLAAERLGAQQREAELAAQLKNLEAAKAEVASLHTKLEDSDARLADAAKTRAQAEAELAALKRKSAAADQQTTALKAEIDKAQQQLKAKDGALEDLTSLRTERDELRDRRDETEAALKREQAENDRLARELAIFRTAARTATIAAQQHLLAIENKIKELNGSAGVAGPSGARSGRAPGAQPDLESKANGDSGGVRAQSAPAAAAVAAPKTSAEGGHEGNQLIPSAHAAEKPADSSAQVRLVDELTRQRELLNGWIKELDNGSMRTR